MRIATLKNDFLASIVVFLVAIPLCLGVALACGAPLLSGMISGIIGGIIVGLISQSRVSVSGPSPGMVAIVITVIAQLGSFEIFLLALFLAGFLQVVMGMAKTGFIANYVPTTVIKGLLAAIGILIIIKQIPLAFGYFSERQLAHHALQAAQEDFHLSPFAYLQNNISLGATLISLFSLLILLCWDKISHKKIRIIPAGFIVVVFGILANLFYTCCTPSLALLTPHLVNIPVHDSFVGFIDEMKHPHFKALNNSQVYFYAIMIAVVASLESLLNLGAIEKIDKKHRYCSRNRELVAQGIGNMASGLIGGLPITSVIVRSSVNVYAGARSKLSTIFHGILLLLSLTLLARCLNYIPIASLAAILIYTGYKLASVPLFKEIYAEGWRYFIPFIITLLAIVLTNLLLGIVIGLIVSLLFILWNNSKNCFTQIREKHPAGEILRLMLPQQVTFLHRAAIIDDLNKIPKNSRVIIDAYLTDYIDEDIIDVLKDTREALRNEKDILFNFEGFQEHYQFEQHASFISATTYDVQARLTPQRVLALLKEGNTRFVNNTPIHKNYKQQIANTAASQHPIGVVLGCIDSRVPVELIFDLTLGDLFVVRIAGNIANVDILGSLEFSCEVAGAKVIMVLGHRNCGAVKAACENFKLGHLTQLVDKIKPAIAMELNKTNPSTDADEFLLNVTRNNIELTKNWLYQNSEILKGLIDSGKVTLVGAFYDITTGTVKFE